MTGVAVIEHSDSIKFNNIAIEHIGVIGRGLDSIEDSVFILDSKKIKQIQEELKSLDLYKGKISGRLNRDLKKSITKYQKNESFEADGIITKELYEKIVGIEIIDENQLELPFNQDSFANEDYLSIEETASSQDEFLPFWTRPINPIHTSQPPKSRHKDNFYAWGGKDDFLFIGVFMILVAASLVAAFFFA